MPISFVAFAFHEGLGHAGVHRLHQCETCEVRPIEPMNSPFGWLPFE